MDLSTLNTIIAFVIILLVLSLIVQSFQALLKKLLKLKSGQIVKSLEDLFSYVKHPEPKVLAGNVVEEFKRLGHVSTLRKRLMLDSITKGDLQKILSRLYADKPTDGDDIRAKVEEWFDPVMQAFEERYTRKMKAVAVLVSLVVVVYLNANFFKVYRNLSKDDTERSLIVAKYEEMVAARKAANSQVSVTSPTVMPSPPPTPASAFGPPAKASSQPSPSESPSPVQPPSLAEGEAERLSDYAAVSAHFGFEPLTLDQTELWILSVVGKTPLRNSEGQIVNKAGEVIAANCDKASNENSGTEKCEPKMLTMSRHQWALKRREDIFTLLGWGIMTLLLSVGAPFWQDTLEALFGLKGLIRQKTGTDNVEKNSGEGQPKD